MDYEWAKAATKCVRSATISILILSTPIFAGNAKTKDANLVKEVLEGHVQIAEQLSSFSELANLETRIENLITDSSAIADREKGELNKSAQINLAQYYLSDMNSKIVASETKLKHLDSLSGFIEHRPAVINSQRQSLEKLMASWKDQTNLLGHAIANKIGVQSDRTIEEPAKTLALYYAYLQDRAEGLHFKSLESWDAMQKGCAKLVSSQSKLPSECHIKLESNLDTAIEQLTTNLKLSKDLLSTECNSTHVKSADCEKLNLVLSASQGEVAHLDLGQQSDLETWLAHIRSKYSNRGGAK